MYVRYNKNSKYNKDYRRNKLIHYKIQSEYYEDIDMHFGIESIKEKNELRGLREFFYGDKNNSRMYWLKNPAILFNPKFLLIYFISFLPNRLFTLILESRARLRLKLLINKVFRRKKYQIMVNEFNTVLNQLK